MKLEFIVISMLIIFLTGRTMHGQTPGDLGGAWDKAHISNKFPSNIRHNDLKESLVRLQEIGVKMKEVGRSVEDREIFELEWGEGNTKVFLWSQMHGDEPTATSALIDLFAFLRKNQKTSWVKNLQETITIRAIPMLNPDGAERFKRHNAQGLDINRDARNRVSPEAKLLMNRRNSFEPDIGFNLHNQGELTTVGRTTNQAAISLLAVRAHPDTAVSAGQIRNDRICSIMISAVAHFVPRGVGKYSDSYTENAFGDIFSDMGTPVILIETGGFHPENELFLVKLNFVAILSALHSLADGSEAKMSAELYDNLEHNRTGLLHNYIFRGASIVSIEDNILEGCATGLDCPLTKRIVRSQIADLAVNHIRTRAEVVDPPMYIQRIGNLSKHRGLNEFDAKTFHVFSRLGPLKTRRRSAIYFFKKDRTIDWLADDFNKRYEPDAIFYRGKWLTGAELFVK